MRCRPTALSTETFAGAPARERRRHERRPASGPIHLFGEDPLPFHVGGEIVDISEGGFRIAHNRSFHTGQVVSFEHAGGRGRARVVWNCVLPGGVETGFLILN